MKLLQLTPWPTYNAKFGGAERCRNLLKNVGEVTSLALTWGQTNEETTQDNVTFIHRSVDGPAIDQARKLFANGISTYDPMPMLVKKHLSNFRATIDTINPDLIILEHPWLLDILDGRPYLYDSHNCETVNAVTRKHTPEFQLVADMERRATQQAEHMVYTSTDDLTNMRKLYPFTTGTTHIPNGVQIPALRATGEQLNLVFIGSLYGPNIQAAKTLITLAPLLAEYTIKIIGPVCAVLESHYPNVELLGEVNDKALDYHLQQAHAFINLTTHGTGTQLKVGRAIAYGIPVIASINGARGYTSPIITNTANMPAMVRELRKNWQHHSDQAYAEALTLDWNIVSTRFAEVIHSL